MFLSRQRNQGSKVVRRSGRRPRLLWRWALAFLILFATASVVLWQLSWVAPLEYRPPDAADEQVMALAQDVEKRFAEELHAVRDDDDQWTLRVREHQVNAWLASRLEPWIAHEQDIRWPSALQQPQVKFYEGRVRLYLAVRMPDHERPRVISATLQPRIDEDGLWLPVQQLSFGMIPLPGEPMERLARLVEDLAPEGSVDHPALAELLDIFSGHEPLLPILSLADRRNVQVLALRFAHGYVDVTSRTLQRSAMAQHVGEPGSDGSDSPRTIGAIE